MLRDFIRDQHAIHTQAGFYEWLQRREAVLVLSYLAHSCTIGIAGTELGWLLAKLNLGRLAGRFNLTLPEIDPQALTLEAFYVAVRQALPAQALEPGPSGSPLRSYAICAGRWTLAWSVETVQYPSSRALDNGIAGGLISDASAHSDKRDEKL